MTRADAVIQTAPTGGGLPVPLAPVNVIVGHYGVGKTNFALNLALDAAAEGFEVTLADMDVVNPYFRSSEYRELLEDAGVRLIAPVFGGAGTSLDVPSLTGQLSVAAGEAYRDYEILRLRSTRSAQDDTAEPLHDVILSERGEQKDPASRVILSERSELKDLIVPRQVVIVDAGGDDVGATALARFAPAIAAGPYEMIYVVNAFRNLTREVDEAIEVLREIEAKSHLTATAVVGNSHLQSETELAHVEEGLPFAQAVAMQTGLPLRCITVPISAIQQENAALGALKEATAVYPVSVYVKTPWT